MYLHRWQLLQHLLFRYLPLALEQGPFAVGRLVNYVVLFLLVVLYVSALMLACVVPFGVKIDISILEKVCLIAYHFTLFDVYIFL